MKKEILFVFVFMALALNVSALNRPDVRIADYSMPAALLAAGQSEVTLTLESVGKLDCAYRVIAQASPSYPISLYGPDAIVVGDLCKADGARNVSFVFNADPNANAGNNPVSVSITYESENAAPYSTLQNLNIPVSGSPELRAQVTSSTPIDIHPGDTATVEVTIDNTGSYKAQAIEATLNAPAPMEVKAATKTAIIAELGAKKSAKVTYTIFVPKAQKAGVYAANVALAYIDESGKLVSKTIPVSITVAAKADLAVQPSVDVVYIGTNNAQATFTITNNGQDTAKDLRLKIIPQFPISTDGSERLVGDFAAGATTQVAFNVNADKEAAAGSYAIQIQATYKDSDGTQYRESVETGITVKQKDLYTSIVADYWFIWAIVLIALAVFFGSKAKSMLGKKK
ncbi:MAG: NEW3 domain-containing protein [Candidatus Micrarchaeia archaeon]